MSFLRLHSWRLLMVASGLLLAAGGPMHPSGDAEDPLREELAAMTADDMWVPGHSLIAASSVLLAVGLWVAWRQRVWPTRVQRTLGIATLVMSLYVVETFAHLAAVVDSEALADGHAAPVAFTHIGLASVLYPVSGWALVFLALAFGRAWTGWRRAIAVVGVVGGLLHAFSVPLTILMPEAEITPVFAGAGMSIALFSLLTGVAGAPRTVSPSRPKVAAVV